MNFSIVGKNKCKNWQGKKVETRRASICITEGENLVNKLK